MLVTLERLKHWAVSEEEIHFNVARYLADIVIRLDEVTKNDYYYQTIEVTKTRYNRRILGKHLLKLKSDKQPATGEFDPRCGIVIYPSIHYHLVHSRVHKDKTCLLPLDIDDQTLPLGSGEKTDNSKNTQEIESDTCIVITGPYGGHKFAIAINLLLRTKTPNQNDGHKLIVSFAEEREIKLKNVALLENFKNWRGNLTTTGPTKQEGKGMKVWKQQFGLNHLITLLKDFKNWINNQTSLGPIKQEGKGMKVWKQQFGPNGIITLLNFRMGQIMPEEFLYIFEKYLNDHNEIDSVLFTDTA